MNSRLDHDLIARMVPQGARVLDLGCGDGTLLARLATERGAIVRGVEISETKVRACISRGLSVRQGNIEEGLDDYRDAAFDCVVLSDTLAYLNQPEPVVRNLLRVGKRAIISFENASHWRARVRALRGDGFGFDLVSGEPRLRAITHGQFEQFVSSLGAKVHERAYVNSSGLVLRWPKLRARMAVFSIAHQP